MTMAFPQFRSCCGHSLRRLTPDSESTLAAGGTREAHPWRLRHGSRLVQDFNFEELLGLGLHRFDDHYYSLPLPQVVAASTAAGRSYIIKGKQPNTQSHYST